MADKMTNVKALEVVLNMELDDEVREKIENIKASLKKKAGKESKAEREKKAENFAIGRKIVDFLVDNAGGKYTVTDLIAQIDDIKVYSNQKISAIMKKLFESGVVLKESDKRKSLFYVNPAPTEAPTENVEVVEDDDIKIVEVAEVVDIENAENDEEQA